MKQFFLLVLLCIVFAKVAFCQEDREFKPFKVDVSIGGAIPEGSGAKVGVLFAVEPKYSIIDKLALGLRLETAISARASVTNADGTASEVEVKGTGSYLATADYYFSNNGFRPFAGIGLGLNRLASATTASDEVVSGGTKFGQMVRAGFEAGHFRLGIEYNIVPNTNGFTSDNNGNIVPAKIQNGYFGFKLGVVFGGGRLE